MILKHPIRLLATLAAGVCMLAITAAASSTNVNDNADELALYCTWSPDYACAPGAFTFTASASCDGEVPNPTQMISISAIGAATGQANGFNEVTLTMTNVPPGAVTVTFSGAGESHTVTVWSLKVDIVQERAEYCVHHGADTLDLTEKSCLGPDTAYWYRDGLYAGAGHSHTLTPSAMEPGTYTVTAEAAALPACQDTCTVHVVKVDLSVAGVASTNKSVAPGGLICVTNGPGQTATRTALTINKCDPADWDGSVELLWTAGNVKVYDAPSNGVEVVSGAVFTNTALPTSLWVEGTAPSAAAGDVVFRLNPVGIECPQAAEGCDKVVMTAVKVELITPAGDPVASPVNSGDGQNEFTYSTASPGVLTMNLKASVMPSGISSQIEARVYFTVDKIGSSTIAWDAANIGGKPIASGNDLLATVTFTNLPAKNSDFGAKKAAIYLDGDKLDEGDYEVFYPATAANHPGGTSTVPNWFFYYKQNAGGGTFSYTSIGRSSSTSAGGDITVKIGNEAYIGDQYITTRVSAGQLLATGWSAETKYYANFLGVLAHERHHANNETIAGPPIDSDGDFLASAYETSITQTDPNDKFSARGVLSGSAWDDGEVYAGGPVEQNGIENADTSQDWANPGTNSKP